MVRRVNGGRRREHSDRVNRRRSRPPDTATRLPIAHTPEHRRTGTFPGSTGRARSRSLTSVGQTREEGRIAPATLLRSAGGDNFGAGQAVARNGSTGRVTGYAAA